MNAYSNNFTFLGGNHEIRYSFAPVEKVAHVGNCVGVLSFTKITRKVRVYHSNVHVCKYIN